MASPINVAFGVGNPDISEMAVGVAEKLTIAAVALGDHIIPRGDKPSQGAVWYAWASNAGLEESEFTYLSSWIEDAYGKPVSDRMSEEAQKHVNGTNLRLSVKPSSGETRMVAGGTITTNLPNSASLGSVAGGVVGGAKVDSLFGAGSNAAGFSAVTVNAAADALAQSIQEGEIPILTWAFITTTIPPMGHAEVRYGVDPSTTKLYKTMKDSVGITLLPKLCSSSTSTLQEFNAHFLAASTALNQSGYSGGAHRISACWMEVQRFLPAVALVRAYFTEVMRRYPGRGLPVLVDMHIVLLIVCAAMGGASSDSADKAAVTRLEMSLAAFRVEHASMKAELKELMAGRPKCEHCGRFGHKKKDCFDLRGKKEDKDDP